MTRMRSRTMPCPACKGLCSLQANLDTGKIEKATLPGVCSTPTKCARKFVDGIWDHPFDEGASRAAVPHQAK